MSTEPSHPSSPGKRPAVPSVVKVVLVVVGAGLVATALLVLVAREEAKRVHELPVALPVHEVTAVSPVALTISVVGKNRYSIDGNVVSIDEIKRRLVRADGAPVASVLIVSPPEGDFGATVLLLDAVRLAGIEQLTVETRMNSGTGSK